MYHFAALTSTGKSDLKGAKVLDIGCGRGGGLSFLAEHFEPEAALGIDYCPRQISFAKDAFKDFTAAPLYFLEADAENITDALKTY